MSDEAPILFPYTNEEKEDSEEYIEELEDEEESEGETSESGEESVDEADLPGMMLVLIPFEKRKCFSFREITCLMDAK